MEILFVKIILISAAAGWSFVEKLTANYGLFDWLPQYYPRKLQTLLTCVFCVSGWLSLGGVIFFYKPFGGWVYFAAIIAPLCSMATVKVLFYKE
jgi:hypothetical protein